MYKLYDCLKIDYTATQGEIEKNYKKCFYKAYLSKNKEEQVEINHSYQILSDPYKRSLYNKFGDKIVPRLQNPEESYFITRTFNTFNAALFLAFVYLNIINYFFLGLFCLVPNLSNMHRFSFFIFSPILLLVINFRTSKHYQDRNPHFKVFRATNRLLFLNALSLFILTSRYHPGFLVATELTINIYITLKAWSISALKMKMPGFLFFKTTILLLYYLDLGPFLYFLPCVILLGLSIFNLYAGILASLLILPMCFSIFLSDITSYSRTAMLIHLIHATIGLAIISMISNSLSKLFIKARIRFDRALLPPV